MLQIATLLGATCCRRLVTLLRRVATCCELKIELVRLPGRNIIARTRPNDYNIMQHPKMLREKFDQFQIWANSTQHVATRRNRVAKRVQHVAPNNVARYVALKCCHDWNGPSFSKTFPLLLLRVARLDGCVAKQCNTCDQQTDKDVQMFPV